MNNVEKMREVIERITDTYNVLGIYWTPEERSKDIFKHDYIIQFISKKHDGRNVIAGYKSAKDMIKKLEQIKNYEEIWELK